MKKLIKTLSTIGGLAAFIIFVYKAYTKKINEKDMKVQKFKDYYTMTNKWLEIKNKGNNIEEYFKKNGWVNIAIYGMGELGNRLYEEMMESTVKIHYAIDKKSANRYSSITVLTMEDELSPVDVIVVTPIFDYDSIKTLLEEKTDVKIISLEDVIYDFI